MVERKTDVAPIKDAWDEFQTRCRQAQGELDGTADAEVAPSFALLGESEQQQPPIAEEESENENREDHDLELGVYDEKGDEDPAQVGLLRILWATTRR